MSAKFQENRSKGAPLVLRPALSDEFVCVCFNNLLPYIVHLFLSP